MGKIITTHFLTVFLCTVMVNTLFLKNKNSIISTTYNKNLASLKSAKKHENLFNLRLESC